MQYIPYQGSPSRHAFHLLRTLCNPDWLRQPKRLPDAVFQHRARPLYYGNKKQAVYKYDKHMAYPPCFSIALGCGEAEYAHIGLANFTLNDAPGIWHMADDSWLWTPEAKRAKWQNVKEGWYWPEKHQVLKPLYDYLKRWHDESEPGSPARTLLKQTYTSFIGLLAHPSQEPNENYLYRPDWRSMIVSEAKARLQGQIEKVWQAENITPVAVKVDALYYRKRVHSLPIGEKIGNFREEML